MNLDQFIPRQTVKFCSSVPIELLVPMHVVKQMTLGVVIKYDVDKWYRNISLLGTLDRGWDPNSNLIYIIVKFVKLL